MDTWFPFETQSELIFFEFPGFHASNHTQEEEEAFAEISSNYDYKILSNGAWLIFFDIGITINPLSDFIYRTGFQFPQTDLADKDVFNPRIVNYMVNLAVKNCIKEYKYNCEDFEVMPKEIAIQQETIQSLTDTTINQYFDYRKQDDIDNAYLINNIGLECESDINTRILFLCTFMVVDEILYSSTGFDSTINRKIFNDIVPISKYNTLAKICRRIEKDPIQLTIFENILFLQCLDCALQILLSDKAERMMSYLERQGMTEDIRKIFFTLGTEYFGKVKEELAQLNARIMNLEENRDWASLFRALPGLW